MLIFLYDLVTVYIIPGMMLAFGICLLFLSIPDKEGLKNYVFARKVMGVTFLVYCVALICEAVTREPLVGDLLNSMIVIAIGITQAFLFTYSLIALLDIGFFTKATACRETLVIAITTVAAFALFFLCHRAAGRSSSMAFRFGTCCSWRVMWRSSVAITNATCS